MLPIIISICIVALIIGSFTDLKTREVPDWLNYSLIFTGLSIHTIYSIIFKNPSFIIKSLLGFLTLLVVGYLMYRLGQWGGGDSKMIMGLGALIGLDLTINNFLLGFFINIMLIGSIYGLIWSTTLAIKNKKEFSKTFKKILKNKKLKKTRIYLLVVSLIFATLLALSRNPAVIIPMIVLVLLINFTYYLWAFVKAVEKVCMYKYVTPDKLTEGDWIVKDIKINKEYICGPKDLGIEEAQIKKLIKLWKKGEIKKILIKDGMPFVPSFLIAFIVTMIHGNLFLILLS